MLHLSYVAARDRQTGETSLLEFVSYVSAGGDRTAVGALNDRLRSSEGADLRARYSDATVVIDNHVVASYEFPDPAGIERTRKEQQLAEARTVLNDAAQRELAAAQAAATHSDAKAERKSAQARVAELEKELGIEPPPTEPVKPPAPFALEQLEDATDEQLLQIAASYKVEITPETNRDQLIAAIRTAAGYEPPAPVPLLADLTVAELRAKAIAAGIDTAGLTRKQELLDAIAAHEASKAS